MYECMHKTKNSKLGTCYKIMFFRIITVPLCKGTKELAMTRLRLTPDLLFLMAFNGQSYHTVLEHGKSRILQTTSR